MAVPSPNDSPSNDLQPSLFSVLAETSVPRELPAWLGSMFLHMGLILLAGSLWMPPVPRYAPQQLEASLTTPEPELPPEKPIKIEKQEFDLRPSELPNVGVARPVGEEVEFSAARMVDVSTELPRRLPDVKFLTDVRVPYAQDITKAPNRATRTQIKGVVGDGVVGTQGALDRITQEILRSLESGPTLVVWLFDKSGSMQVQRETVHQRFDQVYAELGLSKAVAPRRGVDQPLLTSVVSFGKDVTFHIDKPTDDLAAIKQAVADIANDESGVEMTFTAIGMTAQRYEPYRFHSPARQVMVVVFTDEVGDDENRLEDCVQICKRNQIPVYVAGVPAPFGRTNIEIKYVDPDPNYDQSVQWIPIRQGPETLVPEMVQLNFSGVPNRDEGIYRLDSGFGPYCLTRLCYETGGMFFAVHANRERVGEFVSTRETPVFQARLNYFFDPLVMRPYRPDYVPPQEYLRLISKNGAKAALIEAARQSMVDPMNRPTLVFRKTGDDDASMKRALDEAQKAAAILEPKMNLFYGIIKQGEKDRPKLVEPRWRAGFDLALGRILAVKVRTESYNQMLARAKGGMKYADPRTNVLRLVPSNEVSVSSTLAKQAEQARTLLEGVAREHRGTPWAMWAEEELKDPIGWKWQEEYDPPTPPRPQAPPRPAPNAPAVRPNNQPPQFRREVPKPVRQNVRL